MSARRQGFVLHADHGDRGRDSGRANWIGAGPAPDRHWIGAESALDRRWRLVTTVLRLHHHHATRVVTARKEPNKRREAGSIGVD